MRARRLHARSLVHEVRVVGETAAKAGDSERMSDRRAESASGSSQRSCRAEQEPGCSGRVPIPAGSHESSLRGTRPPPARTSSRRRDRGARTVHDVRAAPSRYARVVESSPPTHVRVFAAETICMHRGVEREAARLVPTPASVVSSVREPAVGSSLEALHDVDHFLLRTLLSTPSSPPFPWSRPSPHRHTASVAMFPSPGFVTSLKNGALFDSESLHRRLAERVATPRRFGDVVSDARRCKPRHQD